MRHRQVTVRSNRRGGTSRNSQRVAWVNGPSGVKRMAAARQLGIQTHSPAIRLGARKPQFRHAPIMSRAQRSAIARRTAAKRRRVKGKFA